MFYCKMSYCVFSSLSFITNCVAAYLYGEYIYSILWGLLCITSVLTHGLRSFTNVHTVYFEETYNNISMPHRLLFWAFMADKIVLYLVVICGVCLIYDKIQSRKHIWGSINSNVNMNVKSTGAVDTNITNINEPVFEVICWICIVVTFVLTFVLYCYGYIRSMYSFDPVLDVANKWHCMVHWIGSFGHHCILLL